MIFDTLFKIIWNTSNIKKLKIEIKECSSLRETKLTQFSWNDTPLHHKINLDQKYLFLFQLNIWRHPSQSELTQLGSEISIYKFMEDFNDMEVSEEE